MSAPAGPPRSGYLDHLPAVLAEAGPQSGGLSVNDLLLAAETILSGRPGQLVEHRDGRLPAHTHDGIQDVIDRLHLLLDPYRAPGRFLSWLAGCVGADLVDGWGEHQQRRAIAEAVPVLGLCGLKEGLRRRLDLYTVATRPPRIAIDDGSRVLFTTPVPGRRAAVHTLSRTDRICAIRPLGRLPSRCGRRPIRAWPTPPASPPPPTATCSSATRGPGTIGPRSGPASGGSAARAPTRT